MDVKKITKNLGGLLTSVTAIKINAPAAFRCSGQLYIGLDEFLFRSQQIPHFMSPLKNGYLVMFVLI